ncbi:MAG: AbrB/MazE/SpoVT family DNA-binding domain-containing protein [Deltaproteobacteria bacterium]|nr:AbrB/MazE/SpoVT family DNA-binding domain-containing protein [Deltaproteobacteria bacterium]
MTVKVSPKYQVVIPEEVRRALGLKAGAKVEVLSKGRVAYIVPVLELEAIQAILSKSSDQLKESPLRDKKDREVLK